MGLYLAEYSLQFQPDPRTRLEHPLDEQQRDQEIMGTAEPLPKNQPFPRKLRNHAKGQADQ